MRLRQTLPLLWLISDRRNDAVLEPALRQLPPGSGLIFRHYHLPLAERKGRFAQLARLCRKRGHTVAIAGRNHTAKGMKAHCTYGEPALVAGPRLATAHTLKEIGRANRTGADLVLLSPVFPTRSHPGARALGPVRFLLLARRSLAPVIALGGMDRHTARRLPGFGWAAIDGLSLDVPGARTGA
jgi:thiamine-phosphate pyrophosphorylase